MSNEETLENITMEILKELEYECINEYEMEKVDYSKIILEEKFRNAIHKINNNDTDERTSNRSFKTNKKS